MGKCPKCDKVMVLWKDAFGRFPHFFECKECKKRFTMSSPIQKTRELTTEECAYIDNCLKKD